MTDPELTSDNTESTAPSERLIVIDMLRGVAMVLMALDHSLSMANYVPLAESYNGLRPDLGPPSIVFLGLVTNISSGIFFILAGTSIAFFAASRRRRGWTETEITRFFLTRAAILFALDLVIEPLAWAGPVAVDVLTSLAFCIAVLAFARLLPLKTLALAAGAMFLLYPALVSALQVATTQDSNWFIQIMLAYHPDHPPHVEFPLLSRLSLVLFGAVWGKLLLEKKTSITGGLIWVGFGSLLLAIVIRLIGGFGNGLPYDPNWPIVYFLIDDKQPPSIFFLLFNFSVAVFVLVWLNRHQVRLVQMKIGHVLMLFGQTALFFFVVHLLLYKVMLFTYKHEIEPLSFGSSLFIFVLGLVIMTLFCTIYRDLKRKHPNSIFQYL